MRKILSLLGTMILFVTLTTSATACNCIKPQPATMKKTNLNTIIQLTGLNLVTNVTKKFKDFDSEILKANEFKKHPLVAGYILKYYISQDKNSNIVKEKVQQKSGNFFIILQATNVNDDPYWFGITNFLSITIN